MLNSKETVESIKFAVALWKETMDEGGLAWDDTNNNRAFLSQTISATNNGASIYIEAKKKPDTLQDREGHADVAGHPCMPAFPGASAASSTLPGVHTDMLMAYSKNQKAAKDFLRWIQSKPAYEPVVRLAAGLHLRRHQGVGQARGVGRRPGAEAVHATCRHSADWSGYAGPPDRKAAEVVSKYIIVDMYAKAIQGMLAEEAAKWAHAEATQAYA